MGKEKTSRFGRTGEWGEGPCEEACGCGQASPISKHPSSRSELPCFYEAHGREKSLSEKQMLSRDGGAGSAACRERAGACGTQIVWALRPTVLLLRTELSFLPAKENNNTERKKKKNNETKQRQEQTNKQTNQTSILAILASIPGESQLDSLWKNLEFDTK